MSDRLWSSAFNRDPDIIGSTLKLNGTIRTPIGITPPGFFQLHNADVFFPTIITADLKDSLVGGPGDIPLRFGPTRVSRTTSRSSRRRRI